MKNAKILIFEDEPALPAIYGKFFASAGFETKVFNRYDKPCVVDVVAEEKPDIIYADILMPGMDGLTAVGLLKKDERTKDIPIIVVGNFPTKETTKKSLKAGAIFYCCVVDYTPQKLVGIFREFLDYRLELEKIPEGRVVNSLRNKEIVKNLQQRYKELGIPAISIFDAINNVLGKDAFSQFSSSSLFDPRSPNVFQTSPEKAQMASQRGKYVDELDRKYLAEKSAKNTSQDKPINNTMIRRATPRAYRTPWSQIFLPILLVILFIWLAVIFPPLWIIYAIIIILLILNG